MLRYRCRMCGEEFQNTHVPDVMVAIQAIINGWSNPWPDSAFPLPGLVEMHVHQDGYGTADLIGGWVME